MSIIHAPWHAWFNQTAWILEWGLSCGVCREQYKDKGPRQLDWRRMYTPEGYLEHLEECDESQKAWNLYELRCKFVDYRTFALGPVLQYHRVRLRS